MAVQTALADGDVHSFSLSKAQYEDHTANASAGVRKAESLYLQTCYTARDDSAANCKCVPEFCKLHGASRSGHFDTSEPASERHLRQHPGCKVSVVNTESIAHLQLVGNTARTETLVKSAVQ